MIAGRARFVFPNRGRTLISSEPFSKGMPHSTLPSRYSPAWKKHTPGKLLPEGGDETEKLPRSFTLIGECKPLIVRDTQGRNRASGFSASRINEVRCETC